MSGAVLFVILMAGMRGLPPLGAYQGVYGALINTVAVAERHATDVVSTTNFDYRGFDTLGEEFILFTSVIGVAMLLRQHRDEHDERPSDEEDRRLRRRVPPMGDAVRDMAMVLVLFDVTFGGYVVSHGTVSPGGGFQGGVILATAPLVIYLASGPRTFHRVAPDALVEITEASGAAGYIAVGALGLALSRPFLTNVLPLGVVGTPISGGTIFALNVTVGVEVAAAFVLLLIVFVRAALETRLSGAR
ncbi:Na(+) H(+) antiporter subunit B [Minicystis rosea]|nr:Na(+) H(+) antiporter subunit B [Minicystis rosea]